MKPRSRVISLVFLEPEPHVTVAPEYLALCEDGSIWNYSPYKQPGRRWNPRERYKRIERFSDFPNERIAMRFMRFWIYHLSLAGGQKESVLSAVLSHVTDVMMDRALI